MWNFRALVTQYNLNFLDNLSTEYNILSKPIPENDPFSKRNNYRAGVALMCHKTLTICEVDKQSDRIVGAEIILDKDMRLYCFAVYLPSSSRSNDAFFEQLDDLDCLCNAYSEYGKVLVIGDMNVKVEGDRFRIKKHDNRSSRFKQFMSNNNFISANMCKLSTGPIGTFTTSDGQSTPIDHILIEPFLSDSLIKCEVIDEPQENHSDRRPVICSLDLTSTNEQRTNSNGIQKISWKKRLLL